MKNLPTYITSIGLLLAALIPANGESILIDLSSASEVTNPAGDGKHWNVLGDHTGGNGSSDASIADLIDSNNAASGFSLTVDVTNILSNGTSGAGFGGDGINGPSAADPFDESAVITDGIFNNNASNGTAVFIFKGLTANAQYDFSAIGGRASNGVDGQIVVLDSNTPLGTADVTTQAAYTLPNNGTVLSFFANSNASGEIFFEFRRKHTNSTSGNATINALSITEPLGLIQSFSNADEDQHDIDSNSFIHLAGDLQADGSILLSWPSKPGDSFEIHSSMDLSDWSNLIEANYPAANSGASTSYTIPAPADPNVFYQITLK